MAIAWFTNGWSGACSTFPRWRPMRNASASVPRSCRCSYGALIRRACGDSGGTRGPPVAAAPITHPETPAPAKGAHGRRRAPDTLERVPLVHDLTDAEKESLGGESNLVALPDEVTEQWEYKPSSLFVLEHHQKKYVR